MPEYTLHHGDCLEYMQTLDPWAFDAIVTDPPYGIGITRSPRLSLTRGFKDTGWDDLPASSEMIDAIIGAGVPTVIWGGNYFDLPPTRCFLVWDKNNAGRDFADCEMAWTNQDAVARRFVYRPMNMDGGKVHPTQKPVALMEWCIEMFTKPGDVVFDPYMGSGSTGVACVRLGRGFIGCELDERHYETARRRISEAQLQPSLLTTRSIIRPDPQLELFDA